MLANELGIIGGGMHIAMHAFGKITLFFCAGAILVGAHKTEISEMDGLGRRMPFTMAAFLVASLSIIGLPPLGGMWTFYISCGAYLGLLWLFARRENRVGDLFWIAGLYGLLGITHLFTIVPAVILFLVAFATKWRDGHRRFLLAQAVAAGVGALASASYWAPLRAVSSR